MFSVIRGKICEYSCVGSWPKREGISGIAKNVIMCTPNYEGFHFTTLVPIVKHSAQGLSKENSDFRQNKDF